MFSPSPTRRAAMLSLAASFMAITAAQAQAPQSADTKSKVPVDQLMAKDALPDIVQGKADAPVTMIEYASMTCPHCAHFHETVYPTLLKDYVDTGKVKFILREFPLDQLAAAAFMLARCSGPDKRTAVVDLLFTTQKTWTADKPLDALMGLLRQTGMSKDAFEACLKNQKLYDQINDVRDRGSKQFDVTATPTFYVNGTKVPGEVNAETLSKILDPMLAKKS